MQASISFVTARAIGSRHVSAARGAADARPMTACVFGYGYVYFASAERAARA
jgi:hypothetical protein